METNLLALYYSLGLIQQMKHGKGKFGNVHLSPEAYITLHKNIYFFTICVFKPPLGPFHGPPIGRENYSTFSFS